MRQQALTLTGDHELLENLLYDKVCSAMPQHDVDPDLLEQMFRMIYNVTLSNLCAGRITLAGITPDAWVKHRLRRLH